MSRIQSSATVSARLLAVLVAMTLPLTACAAKVGDPAAASKAADYLVAQPAPTTTSGVADLVLALAASDDKSYQDEITAQVTSLKSQAAGFVEQGGATAAAKLAIAATAVGESATDFGGVNLVTAMVDGIAADGSVGDFPGPFASGMVMVALQRTQTAIPAAMVSYLARYQQNDGGFGLELAATATMPSDADSTALAILGLNAADTTEARELRTRALDWARANQMSTGAWDGWSPVNATAMMATIFGSNSTEYAKALTYIVSQQLDSGALKTGAAGASTGDVLATSQGIFVLTADSYANISYDR